MREAPQNATDGEGSPREIIDSRSGKLLLRPSPEHGWSFRYLLSDNRGFGSYVAVALAACAIFLVVLRWTAWEVKEILFNNCLDVVGSGPAEQERCGSYTRFMLYVPYGLLAAALLAFSAKAMAYTVWLVRARDDGNDLRQFRCSKPQQKVQARLTVFSSGFITCCVAATCLTMWPSHDAGPVNSFIAWASSPFG